MAPKLIKVAPADVQDKAQTVAGALQRAAQPGPVPVAGAGSAIDTALEAVVTAVANAVADSTATLLPRATMGLAQSTEAVQQLQGQDADNAQQVAQVPGGLAQQAPLSAGAPAAAPAGAADPSTGMLSSVLGGVMQAASTPMSSLQSVGGMVSGAGQIPAQMGQMATGAFGQLQHGTQTQDPAAAAQVHQHGHHRPSDDPSTLRAPSEPAATPGGQDLPGQVNGDGPDGAPGPGTGAGTSTAL
ncbi:MAG: hypothetical protein JWR32_298 [Mycobacterium sp.]|jgi:hypothetical protein|nr:hypothetical protein [Mycobacterium sp.]